MDVKQGLIKFEVSKVGNATKGFLTKAKHYQHTTWNIKSFSDKIGRTRLVTYTPSDSL